MSSSAVTCAFVSCRRRVFSATRRCTDHQVERLVDPPRPLVRFTAASTGFERHLSPSGFIRDEWKDEDGKISRIGAPARFEYRPNGVIEKESYFLHGRLHRVGGAALVTFDGQGRVTREEWARRGLTHRIDGPAVLTYPGWGDYGTKRDWWVDGVHVGGLDGVASIAETWTDEQIIEEIAGSLYAPALDFPDVHPRALVTAFRAGVTEPGSMIEILRGAPVEWVLAYESAST